MESTIYVPDIECESCVKVLSRAFNKEDGIKHYNIKDDAVIFNFDESKISEEKIISLIKDHRFRASKEPFERKTLSERMKHFKEHKNKYSMELKVINYSVSIFLILLFLEVFSYFLFLNKIPNFIETYGWWIFYLNISIATLAMAYWHVSAYRTRITCMVGMMVGMTIGMQTGLMIGSVVGAVNGFFIGAMVGMISGVIVGALAGKCCGIMGVLEGMMAGLMGGTMGAMISFMMFPDHVLWFMPFYMLINVIILWGLSYMLYEEVAENKHVARVPMDFVSIASISVIITFVILTIMINAPKSALFGVV